MPPQRYRLIVEGELGRRNASAFEGMTILTGDGRTEITAEIIGPGHLQGLVERIGLALTLHGLTPLDSKDDERARTSWNRRLPTGHERTRRRLDRSRAEASTRSCSQAGTSRRASLAKPEPGRRPR